MARCAAMTYDPFRRGEHPVGVRSVELAGIADGRLATEVWYPATAEHAGDDLDPSRRDRYLIGDGIPEGWQAARRDAEPAPGTFPLAVFSHGFAGHRRQSTFLCTHLASHGWVVAAADHPDTFMAVAARGWRTDTDTWRHSMDRRPAEVRLLIAAAGDGRLGVTTDPTRVGVTGHSFGGWTALRVVSQEPRVAGVVALAPAIVAPELRAALDLRWPHPVPVLIVAAERDSVVPRVGIEAASRDLPAPATLVVLAATDHMHFCDTARQIHELYRTLPVTPVPLTSPLPPFAELIPARLGHDATAGLTLAHLEAAVLDREPARAFCAADVTIALGARGIVARRA